MKHIFIPSTTGKQVLNGQRGRLVSFENDAQVASQHPVMTTLPLVQDYVEPVSQEEIIPKANQAVLNAANAAFFALPVGKQILWESLKQKIEPLIAIGKFLEAREILLSVPEIYVGANNDRSVFLSLIPAQT